MNERKIYNIDHYIQKFEKIPSNLWTTNAWENDREQRCQLGHCGETDACTDTFESLTLRRIYKQAFNGLITPVDVNDCNIRKQAAETYVELMNILFDSPGPKERSVNTLKYLKSIGLTGQRE